MEEEIVKHFQLATEYSNNGDHDLAINELECMVALDPDYPYENTKH